MTKTPIHWYYRITHYLDDIIAWRKVLLTSLFLPKLCCILCVFQAPTVPVRGWIVSVRILLTTSHGETRVCPQIGKTSSSLQAPAMASWYEQQHSIGCHKYFCLLVTVVFRILRDDVAESFHSIDELIWTPSLHLYSVFFCRGVITLLCWKL